jgi:hypothetical protein
MRSNVHDREWFRKLAGSWHPFSLELDFDVSGSTLERWSVIVNESATRTPLWDHLTDDDKADLAHAKVDLARFRACIFHTKRLIELSRARIQDSRQLIAVTDRYIMPRIGRTFR